MAPPLDFNATLAEQLRDAGMQMRAMTKPQKQRATPNATPDAEPQAHATEGGQSVGSSVDQTGQPAAQQTATDDTAHNTDKTLRKALGKALAEATAAEASAAQAADRALADRASAALTTAAEASVSATEGATATALVTRPQSHSHNGTADSHGPLDDSHEAKGDSHNSVRDSHRDSKESHGENRSHGRTGADDAEFTARTAADAAARGTAHGTAGTIASVTASSAVNDTARVTAASAKDITPHGTVARTDAGTAQFADGDTAASTVAARSVPDTVSDAVTATAVVSKADTAPRDSDPHSEGTDLHSQRDTTPASEIASRLASAESSSETSRTDSPGTSATTTFPNSPADSSAISFHGNPAYSPANSAAYSHDAPAYDRDSHAAQGDSHAPSLPDAASELWAMSHHSEAPTLSERSWTGGVRGAVLDALRGLAGGRDHVLVNLKRLATHTGISYGSVRNAMSRLTRSGDIRTRQIRMADGHGVRVEFLTLPGQEGTGVATQGLVSHAAVLGQAAMLAQNALHGQNVLHGQSFMTHSAAQGAPDHARTVQHGGQQAGQHSAQPLTAHEAHYHLSSQGAPFPGTAPGAGQQPAYGTAYAPPAQGDAGAQAAYMPVAATAQATGYVTGQEVVGVTAGQHQSADAMYMTTAQTQHAAHRPADGSVMMTAGPMTTAQMTAAQTAAQMTAGQHAPMGVNPSSMMHAGQGMNAAQLSMPAHNQPVPAPMPAAAAHAPGFWDTADSLFAVAWPHVAAAGLGMEHLRALAPIFTVQGFDPAVLPRTLRYLDWELEALGMPEDLPQDPAFLPASVAEAARQLAQSYLRAMQRRGTWPRPAGYEEGDD